MVLRIISNAGHIAFAAAEQIGIENRVLRCGLLPALAKSIPKSTREPDADGMDENQGNARCVGRVGFVGTAVAFPSIELRIARILCGGFCLHGFALDFDLDFARIHARHDRCDRAQR